MTIKEILRTWLVGLSILCSAPLYANSTSESVVGIRLAFEPATLDWTLGDVPIHVINNTVEGLFGISEEGSFVPVEAASNPKKLQNKGPESRYLITLRKDLKWSNGKPVTSTDYIYAWSRLLDPKIGSTYTYLLEELSSFRAINDHQLELTFKPEVKNPSFAVFTHWVTFPMQKESGTTAFNGPYKIVKVLHGSKIILEPNVFHRLPGQLKSIEALIIEDDSTALRLFDQGRIHFLPELGGLDKKLLRTRSDYHTRKSPVLVYLGINLKHPILKSSALRKALSQTIPRIQIPNILSSPHLPTESLIYSESKETKSSALSPELKLLFKKTKLTLGYFEKGLNRTLCEFLQSEWKKQLDVEVELKGHEVKSYWTILSQNPYPIFLNSFGPPVWDESFYFKLLATNNPLNKGSYSNPTFDKLLSNVAQKNTQKQLLQILDEETPIIPIYFRSYDYLLSPKLKGVVVNPMTSLFLQKAKITN